MKKIKYLLILFFLLPLGLLAQQTTISGKVTDYNDGTPLPGVSVRVEGTNTGTVTDGSGKFQINLPEANAMLQISFVGYVTQEIKAADLKKGVISLKSA